MLSSDDTVYLCIPLDFLTFTFSLKGGSLMPVRAFWSRELDLPSSWIKPEYLPFASVLYDPYRFSAPQECNLTFPNDDFFLITICLNMQAVKTYFKKIPKSKTITQF
ncbi:hypothetical protein OTU49_001562 [Cherax quadricarinatus]|uniref:Uncharacterized protein n=1 Tax=Cherax quadricarinatus TaxID=27406 RepID=A0AAW0XJH8_CHEQU